MPGRSRQTTLTSILPPDFDFAAAVHSHGFFALAPNDWDADARVLRTTVQTSESALHVSLSVGHSNGRELLRACVPGTSSITAQQRRRVRAAYTRILRLDESLAEFHQLCEANPDLSRARDLRFGRLLRSESLFEDMVKTMCTCNITWRQTLSVVRRLVDRYGSPATNDPRQRAFPAPEQLARTESRRLRSECGLGYRTEWVRAFARQVADGDLDLAAWEQPDLPTGELHQQLRSVRGIGDYAASHVCILLGRYDRLAIDTEVIAHFRRRFPRRRPAPASIRKHYARYAPFAALVYSWEHWSHYADKSGCPSSWT